jgi:hypothetical protein
MATRKKADKSPERTIDPEFARVVTAFGKDRNVTLGGRGFGSSALKVDGKIFAMVTSKGTFVVKLPKERVDELVRVKTGKRFDSGHGRLMKEWLVVGGGTERWIEIAREARRFVGRIDS